MRKKLLCAVMCCVLICGTFAPKRAYAVAGVDDAAVVIVCALLAAAGVTFATNDGVQDAVIDFLDASAGKYDSTIERLADGYSVYGSVGAFKIPSMAMGGVRLLLEGLFDYFDTDENRQGVSVVSGGDLDIFDSTDLVRGALDVAFSSGSIIRSFDKYGSLLCYFDMSDSYISGNTFSQPYFNAVSGQSLVHNFSSSQSWFSERFYIHFYFVDGNLQCYLCNYDYDLTKNVPNSPIISPYFVFGSTMKNRNFISVDNSVYCLDSAVTPVPDSIRSELGVVDKSIPYGLTFPQELNAPDVIDNFEQRVEEAAGDLAIVVPVDGVVDNTLPYAEAQEQYLVNVNELGEITDTVTESNTWLQKILTAVKALPATVIGTGSLDFSCFSDIGLSSVFPFCIPFDLKNALMGFNVTPAEPIWEISFDGTFMSAAGSFVLDMTKFEKLFAVVRFFIYGGFVVSLILLTRKIIKG